MSNDVANGMGLLLNKLLPTIIQRLKALEAKVEALSNKPEVKKRTRKPKKEAQVPAVFNPDGILIEDQFNRVTELHRTHIGQELLRLDVFELDDKTLTVNDAKLLKTQVHAVAEIMEQYPAATAADIASELKIHPSSACVAMVLAQDGYRTGE